MRKNIFVLIFISFFSYAHNYSDAYNSCVKKSAAIMPKMISCIDDELAVVNEEIDTEISINNNPENSDYINHINKLIPSHNQYMRMKCSIYNISGGQNGILLMRQCELDESILFKNYINDIFEMLEYQ